MYTLKPCRWRVSATILFVAVIATSAMAAPGSWLVDDGVIFGGGRPQAGGTILWGVRGFGATSPLIVAQLDAAGALTWSLDILIAAGSLTTTTIAVRDDQSALLFGRSREPGTSPLHATMIEVTSSGTVTTATLGPDLASNLPDAWLMAGHSVGLTSMTAVGTAGLLPPAGWVVDLDGLSVVGSHLLRDPLGVVGYDLRQVRVSPTDDVYAVGVRTSQQFRHVGADPWIVRLAPDRSIVWQQQYDVGLAADLAAVAFTPSGDVVLAGTVNLAPTALWVLVIDPLGEPLWSRSYSDSVTLLVSGVAVASDGSVVVALRRELDSGNAEAALLQLTATGDVVWGRAFDLGGTSRLNNVWIEPDDCRRVAGVDDGRLLLLATDAAGGSPACAYARDLALVVADLPTSQIVTDAVASPLMVQSWPSPDLVVSSRSVEVDPCDCSQQPGEVSLVRAVRSGLDVQLSWDAAPSAEAYHVWSVMTKRWIPQARESGQPIASGVVGCAPPTSVTSPACVDVGALLWPVAVVYYQVRATCGSGFEGP